MLKPTSSSLSTNTDIYSYDMRGNLIGLAGPVIDLTVVSDTSGFLTSGNDESALWGARRVKQELKECSSEGVESESDGSTATKEKGRKKGQQLQKDRSEKHVPKDEQKKNNPKRKHRGVIPLGLRRAKKLAPPEVEGKVVEDGSTEEVVEKTDSQQSGHGEDASSKEGRRGRGTRGRRGEEGGEGRRREKFQDKQESEAEVETILKETDSRPSGEDGSTLCKEGGRGRRRRGISERGRGGEGRRQERLQADEQEHEAEAEMVLRKK